MNLINFYKNGNYDTDKETTHCYISEFYDKLFSPYKEDEIKLLEVGVQRGGSIKLWRDFFEKAQIFGIDVHINLSEQDCYLIQSDAYKKEIVDFLPSDFQFIIDDGPHTLDSQINFVSLYKDKIKKGGHLIIEDIQSDHDLDKIVKTIDTSNFDFKIYDLRSIKNRYDDIIIDIIKK